MKKGKVLTLATIFLTFTILLTSCITARIENEYTFPDLGEAERIDDGKSITVLNDKGERVFYYDLEEDTITIPRWYWVKIMNYAINTGGL